MENKVFPPVPESSKAILAAMIVFDADIETGFLGYPASMALIKAFEMGGHVLPIEDKKKIGAYLRKKKYLFDADHARYLDYACMVAVQTWNKCRKGICFDDVLIHEIGLYEYF
jgi:hypothetical protein